MRGFFTDVITAAAMGLLLAGLIVLVMDASGVCAP